MQRPHVRFGVLLVLVLMTGIGLVGCPSTGGGGGEEGEGEPAPGELGGACLADDTCNEGLVCNPATDVCDEGEGEPVAGASVNEEWHFDEVEFSLFTEVAFPHLSEQPESVTLRPFYRGVWVTRSYASAWQQAGGVARRIYSESTCSVRSNERG